MSDTEELVSSTIILLLDDIYLHYWKDLSHKFGMSKLVTDGRYERYVYRFGCQDDRPTHSEWISDRYRLPPMQPRCTLPCLCTCWYIAQDNGPTQCEHSPCSQRILGNLVPLCTLPRRFDKTPHWVACIYSAPSRAIVKIHLKKFNVRSTSSLMLQQVLQTKWESPVAKRAQKVKLQMRHKCPCTATFPFFRPSGPKLCICNIPQLKEDLERNMKEFSKISGKSNVWIRHHFTAVWRSQNHFPP